jgi:hypothetical protein
MIEKNVVVCDAPSTLADSSSSMGTVSKKPLMEPCVDPEGAAHVQQDQAPRRVEADRWVELRDRREHDVDGHDGQELREHLDDQQEQQAGRRR